MLILNVRVGDGESSASFGLYRAGSTIPTEGPADARDLIASKVDIRPSQRPGMVINLGARPKIVRCCSPHLEIGSVQQDRRTLTVSMSTSVMTRWANRGPEAPWAAFAVKNGTVTEQVSIRGIGKLILFRQERPAL